MKLMTRVEAQEYLAAEQDPATFFAVQTFENDDDRVAITRLNEEARRGYIEPEQKEPGDLVFEGSAYQDDELLKKAAVLHIAYTEEELAGMGIYELRNIARKWGIKPPGKKLIECDRNGLRSMIHKHAATGRVVVQVMSHKAAVDFMNKKEKR